MAGFVKRGKVASGRSPEKNLTRFDPSSLLAACVILAPCRTASLCYNNSQLVALSAGEEDKYGCHTGTNGNR